MLGKLWFENQNLRDHSEDVDDVSERVMLKLLWFEGCELVYYRDW